MAKGVGIYPTGASFTDTVLPKVPLYPGTWDSTIMLYDVGYAPRASVPANNEVQTNLMRSRCAAVTGLDPSACDFKWYNSLAAGTAVGEVTGKGAIHVASTQGGTQAAASGLMMLMPPAVADWIAHNVNNSPNYAVLVSIFMRTTRAGTATAAQQALSAITTPGAAATQNLLYVNQWNGSIASPTFGTNITQPTVGNAGITVTSASAWYGTKPTDGAYAAAASPAPATALMQGAISSWSNFNYNKANSLIPYRFQFDIVNLSDIAGDTPVAKCNAMATALQTRANADFAAGGRFYGDTFTAAATLCP